MGANSDYKEAKQKRFKRVAEARTNAVIDRLRLLGRCANRQIYAYSEEDVKKVFRAIDKEVVEVKAKFMPSKEERFTL